MVPNFSKSKIPSSQWALWPLHSALPLPLCFDLPGSPCLSHSSLPASLRTSQCACTVQLSYGLLPLSWKSLPLDICSTDWPLQSFKSWLTCPHWNILLSEACPHHSILKCSLDHSPHTSSLFWSLLLYFFSSNYLLAYYLFCLLFIIYICENKILPKANCFLCFTYSMSPYIWTVLGI